MKFGALVVWHGKRSILLWLILCISSCAVFSKRIIWGGFWWDLFLILPVAFYLGFVHSDSLALLQQFSHLILAVIGLGFLSAMSLGSYILASRYLPFVIFGLLSYLEPVLLAGASVAMGERIEAGEWFTYIPIWFAVLLLIIEGVLHLYKQQQNKKQLERNIEHFEKQQHSD